MEDFSQLGGKSFVFASSSTAVAASSPPPPPAALAPPPTTSTYGSSSSYATPLHHHHHHLDYSSTSLLAAKPEGTSSPPPRGAAGGQARDEDAIKAKIVSHPHYLNLVGAYMDCHKVGAPAEVAARLSAIAGEFVARQRAVLSLRDAPSDPELDQFMEAYYHMLVKYREELARPLQEAMDFLSRVESQLKSLTDGSLRLHSSEEKCEACSSEEDLDVSGGEDEIPEFDPRAEERELKHRLLKKYSGYLGSLRQELSKKKKKGKLPKDARQKLLNWWELHYKWPYPSETEKVALAESTGLDQKQINNWFINQRKRHWKPSEDMQFVVDSYYPPNASSFYMGGHFMGDATYRP